MSTMEPAGTPYAEWADSLLAEAAERWTGQLFVVGPDK